MGSGGPRSLQNCSGLTTSGWVGSIPTRSRHRTLLLLVALLACVGPLPAQQVRGTVWLPDSSAIAPSVIVTVSDARGLVVARSVTDAHGAFQLDLARPGRVIIRALRVGYRPTELPSREIAASDTLTLRIVLSAEGVRLSAITVRRSDPCRSRDDSRARVAEVWEEARKALVLANTERARDGLVAEWTQYDRRLDSLGIRVLDQSVQRTRAPSERPFRSRDAETLAREGYVVEDDGGVSYHAPDADVLLSDSFAGAHCFQLVEGPIGTDWIGIRFRPIEEVRARRDVEGTLWLHRASAELRELDFTYTGLPLQAEPAEPGGRVEFTRLADGAFLVTRWSIRMPHLERILPNRVVGGRVRVVGPSLVLRGVNVVGGEVTQVEQGGAVVYRAAGSSLAVRLVTPLGASPAEAVGARVTLVGTDYAAASDSTGVARFPLVIPGRYEVVASTAALVADHDQPVRGEVLVAGDTAHTIALRLPERRRDAAGLGLVPRAALRPAVDFSVTDSLGRPVAGVEIIAVDATGQEHLLRSDSLGAAVLDGLPLGTMRVETRSPGHYLSYGTVAVVEGRTHAKVLLERMEGGTVLGTVRVEAEADERMRYGAFEARRRAGATTASITRAQIERRNPVNAWQMLLTIGALTLIEGPEGVLPVSRRTQSMDLRGGKPCYMRLAIDGVLLPDVPVNLRDRMPPVPEIHGIEVFGGPATVPSEYLGDGGNMVCGLIVVWTR